jgi:cardiolipin synthase
MNWKAPLLQLNLANQLTFLRLVLVPFFVLAMLQSRFDLALTLFAAGALTDALDGLTARLTRQGTPLGAYLDPAADKLLLTAAFILLTDFPSMFQGIDLVHRIPLWLTTLTISRDVLIVCVSLVLYLGFETRSFPPSWWGKLTALAEFVTISAFLVLNALRRDHGVLDGLVLLTLALTLMSGFHYLLRTVRMLASASPEPPPGTGA